MAEWWEDHYGVDDGPTSQTPNGSNTPTFQAEPVSQAPLSGVPPPNAGPAPAEYWIPPNASFDTNNPSGRINVQNPYADPNKEFVQDGKTGGFIEGVGVTIGQGRSTTPGQAQAAYDLLTSKYGSSAANDFLSRNPGDYTRADEALEGEQANRAHEARLLANSRGSSGSGGGSENVIPKTNQFTDPGQKLIEDYAQDRFSQLTNPNEDSGTALFEKYARELIETLKGPAYSAQDESIIKGAALDSIEQERASTRQRWLDEVGRRGIQPSSGVALQGLQNIDQQFNQYRTTVQAQFGRDAIERTRQQRLQVLSTAGQLAGSEEGRLDKAGTYAYMPYGLSQDAFNRNLATVGAGGAPSSVLQNAMALLSQNQNINAYDAAQQAAMTSGLMELLGFLTD